MIKKIITYSATHRYLVIFLTLCLCGVGYISLKKIPLDAIPDLSDTQVIIYSKWDRSPDVIENQVTYPIVSAMLGTAKVKSVRAFSDFGYSFVYVIFEDGTDLYWARSRVLENLNRIAGRLPSEVKTELGPDATSVGWVYQYVLIDEQAKLNSADLRSLHDWNIKFKLQSIPGVAEVASVGGFQKQFQVHVDPSKLKLLGVTLDEVLNATKNANQETGARVIEFSGAEAMVRSRGLVQKNSELENAVVKINPKSQSPILLKQVADVVVSSEMRRGVTDYNGTGDAVGGIVVMRQGEDAPAVIARVKEKIAEISKTLPPGVKIQPVYDRSSLIDRAMQTLRTTLIEELIIVSLIILIFLWHLPSAVVPIITIPVAVLLSFIPLYYFGQSSNIMTLAGIAISIGVLVDGAIVEVENAYRKIYQWQQNGRKEDFFKVRLDALTEVGPSVFFSLLVIAVSFLPIFALLDQEGRLFRPLALSKTLAMIIAALLAITLDPAVRMLFSKENGKYYSEQKHPVSSILIKIYEPILSWCLRFKWIVIGIAFFGVLSTIPIYKKLGSEFMPPLDEGSILYMPTAYPGISVAEVQKILTQQDQIIKSIPEVESVFGKAGRAETATDTAPLSMIETTIVLKPKSEWTKSQSELMDELHEKLNFPGMPNIWTMPIKNRIDMLSTGIRSPIGVKIFGKDLYEIEAIGKNIERELKTLPETRAVVAERIASGRFLDIDFDREKLKIYGLQLKDVQDQAAVAIGGANVAETIFERERYPLFVRMAPDFRQDIESIKKLFISTPTGGQITLESIAHIYFREGASMIRNENAELVGYVYVDIDQTKMDVGTYAAKAKALIAEKIKLPNNYTLVWSGQIENMERVAERLKLVVPLAILLIIFLLYLNTKSWIKVGIIFLAVPFSLIGSVWLLYFLGYNISIATWVGMIALLGLDAETGVFMLMYLDHAYEDRKKAGTLKNEKDLREVVFEGAVHRIRPKFMTVAALFLGLIPIMWASGTGADMMKRIAAPMIGGLGTSFILELLIYPIIFFLWKRKSLRA